MLLFLKATSPSYPGSGSVACTRDCESNLGAAVPMAVLLLHVIFGLVVGGVYALLAG